jgi:hypothetical protein
VDLGAAIHGAELGAKICGAEVCHLVSVSRNELKHAMMQLVHHQEVCAWQ